ncbi:hypothetical protein ACFV3R_27445 [Streptomyces sp. NPDC059740]|uniref:hypothetical protein n=1 Tax=Streptomyces sp. NPDC059740 TaxID=3346926 RepID=UPI003647D4B5
MRRKVRVPGTALATTAMVAVAVSGALSACTGGPSDDAPGDSSGGGDSTTTQAAAPGKYQSLPAACGLPSQDTLRSLLPGDDKQGSRAESEALAGKAGVTYDTDRRTSCTWKRDTGTASRHLSLDMERVASYSPATSDDGKAAELFEQQEKAAGITLPGSADDASPGDSASGKSDKSDKDSKSNKAGKGTGSAKDPGGSAQTQETGASQGAKDDGGAAASASPSSKATNVTGGTGGTDSSDKGGGSQADSTGGSGASTAPRVLDGLGDGAYLNDKLVTTDSGVHRDVTIVVRFSNVIMTITYAEWPTDSGPVPDSKALQSKAQSLAGELADRFSE